VAKFARHVASLRRVLSNISGFASAILRLVWKTGSDQPQNRDRHRDSFEVYSRVPFASQPDQSRLDRTRTSVDGRNDWPT
jgi:hypothetical protein